MLYSQGKVPRPEYPRPQMVRNQWINLNGIWEFEIDHGNSGRERDLQNANKLSGSIVVPFCPESKLSGVECKEFMAAVWYRKEVEIPTNWRNNRVLLHFGAVDYETEVWVNGISVGIHRGGYSSFSFDITKTLTTGINAITVCAKDDLRSGLQPRGKQSRKFYSYECEYTRTTGIWQTVWLEAVPEQYISHIKLIPDPDNACLHVEAELEGVAGCMTLLTESAYEGRHMGGQKAIVTGKHVSLTVFLFEKHLWDPGNPKLYDLKLELGYNDNTVDVVESYFGLRSVKLSDNAILINGLPVFQRLVLDQGFYPDGVYTAPSDDDLRHDIEISMGMGFNGARLHQKVFEARFLYWADKLGYLVWGEHADTGLNITTAVALERFLPEWLEIMKRDFNSPALVGWCPFNETRDAQNGTCQDDEVLRNVYFVTKALDPTRPVIDASGFMHVVTDIFDVHEYEQDPNVFRKKFEPMLHDGDAYNTHPERQKYEGQPYFVSEYGGTWWDPDQRYDNEMSYGKRPASMEEFYRRYEGLTRTLLEHPRICGFCYTQLYDIEQEVNGLYTYERKPKFDTNIIRNINTTKAAIEK